jgi:hypothetical protein
MLFRTNSDVTMVEQLAEGRSPRRDRRSIIVRARAVPLRCHRQEKRAMG